MTYIDRTFREYGNEFFGKPVMDRITDAQVEEARVATMQEVARLTKKYFPERLPKNTAKELFCNYLFSKFV